MASICGEPLSGGIAVSEHVKSSRGSDSRTNLEAHWRGKVRQALACVERRDLGTARSLLQELDELLQYRAEPVATLGGVSPIPRGSHGSAQNMLTAAELRLLPYLQTHLKRHEIGSRLFISKHTVSTQISSIFRKLGASSRDEAVERAVSLGLLGTRRRVERRDCEGAA